MSQYPTADSVIELLNIIAMAVTDIGIAVTTAIIQRGVACTSAISIASPGITGLHAIAEVVVFQQRTVYTGQIGHPTVEIV
ncbi:hypothetical protein HmCmsJML291_01941 [Escherichia coli]|nr:hypothetical protein HmCmsJML291_01941 [Escherichia coli]